MKIARASIPALILSLVACGEAPPPVESPAAAAAPAPAPAEAAPPPVQDAAAPAPVSAEAKKKEEDAKQLATDRATWEKDLAAERARWTPEVRAAAKALVEKSFANTKAALAAYLPSSHRKPASAPRDKYRHPVETLEFFGVKPTSTVLDIGPGEGWYTELVAPLVFKKGSYIATNNDPNGPADMRGTFYGQRFKGFLEMSPEVYGNVKTIVVDGKAPKLGLDGTVDTVLIMRGVHGMVNGGTFNAWLAEIQHALKKDGVLGIEEHRAKADAKAEESAKKGYVPEKWVIEQVEAAGFKLAGKSEINANPKDTKDYPEGVWTLPPTLRLKDVDREKYVAIGESDRMTLKFVKAPVKAAPPATKPKGGK